MNRKELAEIRRRMDREKGNISSIRGCYVTKSGEIVSVFDRPLRTIPEGECVTWFSLFKKVLGGVPGKTGLDLVFSPDQMLSGEEHPLLMELRDTGLREDDVVHTLYQKIVDNYRSEEDYVILLLADSYDVPQHTKDGLRAENADAVFTYFICCVCPVKTNKPGLAYSASEQDFRDLGPDKVVGAPELGFMFPAFDDRTSNIYNALYYIRDPENTHDEFVEAVFRVELPMAGPVQKAEFMNVLEEAIREDLNFEVAQTVNERLREHVEVQKQDKTGDAPVISAPEVKTILADCGLPLERLNAFEEKYDERFGRGTALSAVNIVNTRQMEVRTPNVVIHVNPEFSDLLETRVIDGKKYILIRAEESVEVNGVSVSMQDDR